jgi:hypothetical protein
MHIILGLFSDVGQAQAAVQALLANHTTLPTANIGIVSKDPDGQINFWETAGDVVATEMAIWHDAGFPDQALQHLAKHLHAGSALVVVLAGQESSRSIIATLEQSGGTVYQGALPTEQRQVINWN